MSVLLSPTLFFPSHVLKFILFTYFLLFAFACCQARKGKASRKAKRETIAAATAGRAAKAARAAKTTKAAAAAAAAATTTTRTRTTQATKAEATQGRRADAEFVDSRGGSKGAGAAEEEEYRQEVS